VLAGLAIRSPSQMRSSSADQVNASPSEPSLQRPMAGRDNAGPGPKPSASAAPPPLGSQAGESRRPPPALSGAEQPTRASLRPRPRRAAQRTAPHMRNVALHEVTNATTSLSPKPDTRPPALPPPLVPCYPAVRPTPDRLPRHLPPAHPHARLLPLILHARLPPACRRPASGPPAPCLGCPARFIWQVEEGGSSAKRWTPLPRKPRLGAQFRRRRGRRHGDLQGPTARRQHLEINSYSSTPRVAT
jgi:hypothetical protein